MSTAKGLMEGKRGLIMGVANNRSLAWGIAEKLHEHGAESAFTFQGEALERQVALGGFVGLALPLYIVTMAGQNLPGAAVLRAHGYDRPAGPGG